MDKSQLANFDFSALEVQNEEVTFPEIVSGRVAHIDADFACYAVTAETQDELDGIKPRKTFDDMCHNIGRLLYRQQRLCGAESYIAHVTPSGSDKGGRAARAITKEYQANRSGGTKPEHLDRMRAYVGESLTSIVSLDQEADDAMCQANAEAIARGERELSVIVSKDKDLRMCEGLHWDFQTESIVDVEGFGYLFQEQHELPSGKMSPKKTLGWGTAFFWAQCIMGDTADNIAGLPLAHGDTLAKFGVGKPLQRHRKCGASLAFDLIDGLENDQQAMDVVLHLFDTSPHEFVHWETGAASTGFGALVGDMHLLWMRRRNSNQDINDFILEVIEGRR